MQKENKNDGCVNSNSGISSPGRGAGKEDASTASQKNATQLEVGRNGNEGRNDPRSDEDEAVDPKEGDRRDTSLEKASGPGKDDKDDEARRRSGGWSRSSTDGESNY